MSTGDKYVDDKHDSEDSGGFCSEDSGKAMALMTMWRRIE